MGWKLLLPSHGTAQLAAPSCQPTDSHFPFPVSRFPRQGETKPIFTIFSHPSNGSVLMLRKPSTVLCKISRLGRFRSQFPVSRFPNAGSSHDIQFTTRQFPTSNFPLGFFHASKSNFPFPISHLVPGISSWGAISRFPFPTSHPSSCVEAHSQFPISHFPQPLHNPGIGGVGNERSKDKVKDQFPEGDNELDEFPISLCLISHGKSGMCITPYLP